jgi:glyceraldehyde-3-phosphate dehydrogenase (NADP+)
MDMKSRLEALFRGEDDVPESYRVNTPVVQREYLIDGEIHEWQGPMQDVHSPVLLKSASGIQARLLGSYPLLTGTEAAAALAAAVRAYGNGTGAWPSMPLEARISCLERFTHLMAAERAEMVKLLMWEIGKSHRDAETEFDRTVDYIRDTIDAVKELDRTSARFAIQKGIIGQIRRAPLGVALCMGPYNYPLNETFTTLIPALTMGNTIIFKPPRLGVLLHRPLLRAFRDAFPPGVVNTVYGAGETVISPLMSSGDVNVLAFIGTSRVANHIRRQHPRLNRLRCVLGLEAKNPGIITDSADIDTAVRECILGSLSFNGQRCTALKMLFVHRRVYDTFLERLCAALGQLRIGMPWEPDVFLTPLPEPNKVEYLRGLVSNAVELGATIANEGGGSSCHSLFFPAVLTPVTADMRAYEEEQFGPVIPVAPFDSVDVPLNYVAKSHYGQQVSIFGQDPLEIARLVDALVNQVCRVNINSQCQRGPDTFPFTGRKDSAEGTLSVSDALGVFSIRTVVATKGTESNKELLRHIVRERSSAFLSTDFIL